jgi:lipid II:glycine glycyltransferase (peptidoglycan interpeptide bridge formation enzyme)
MWFSDHIFDLPGCDIAVVWWCKNKFNRKGFARTEWPTSTINLKQDIDVIWGGVKRRFREYINQAKREGIEVRINEHFDEFYRIFTAYNQQKGVRYLQINESTLRKGTLFTAELNGDILVGHVYLEGEDVVFYWRAASRRLTTESDKAQLIARASRLLHWEAIKYARNKGKKEFDFGGLILGEGDNYFGKSRDIFKESYGGRRSVRYSYQKYYTPIGRIYTLGQALLRTYRLLRSRLSKHSD